MSAAFSDNSLTFLEVRHQIIANAIAIYPRVSLRHGRNHFELAVSLVNSSSGDGTKDRYKVLLVYHFDTECWTVAEGSPQPTIIAAAEALLSVLADEISIKGRVPKPGERAERACRRVGGVIWREPLGHTLSLTLDAVTTEPRASPSHGSILQTSFRDQEAVKQPSRTFLNPRSAAPPVPRTGSPKLFSIPTIDSFLVPSTAATNSQMNHQPLPRGIEQEHGQFTRRVSQRLRKISRFTSKCTFKKEFFALKSS